MANADGDGAGTVRSQPEPCRATAQRHDLRPEQAGRSFDADGDRLEEERQFVAGLIEHAHYDAHILVFTKHQFVGNHR